MEDQVEKERLRLEQIRTAMAIADYELRRRMAVRLIREQRKTFMDKIDDFLFG